MVSTGPFYPAFVHDREIRSEWVTFPSDAAQIRGYLARPDVPGRFPAVLVQHEVFGLDENTPDAGPHILDIVQRFVRLAYVGLAVDHYSREGAVPGDTSDAVGRYRVLMNLPDRRVLQDLEAALEYLAAQDFVDPARLGIVGFCQGGLYAFLMAAHSRRIKAAVDFYGQIIYRWLNDNKPVHPISFVPQIACPLLCIYGDRDPTILPGHRERLAQAVREAGKEHLVETVVYDATHGFFRDPDPAVYNAEASQDAWHRTVLFFEKHLI